MDEIESRMLDLAGEILIEVGSPPAWRVVRTELSHPVDPLSGEEYATTMLVLAHHGEPAGALPTVTGTIADDLSLSAYVEQLYDTLVEESGAEVYRPCPEHRHPSWPSVRDRELVWHCPEDPDRWPTFASDPN